MFGYSSSCSFLSSVEKLNINIASITSIITSNLAFLLSGYSPGFMNKHSKYSQNIQTSIIYRSIYYLSNILLSFASGCLQKTSRASSRRLILMAVVPSPLVNLMISSRGSIKMVGPYSIYLLHNTYCKAGNFHEEFNFANYAWKSPHAKIKGRQNLRLTVDLRQRSRSKHSTPQANTRQIPPLPVKGSNRQASHVQVQLTGLYLFTQL